jgi:hypothetical protein
VIALLSLAYKIEEIFIFLVKANVRGKGWDRNKGRKLQAPVLFMFNYGAFA